MRKDKMKEVVEEIMKILNENDIGGVIILSDGTELSYGGVCLTTSWSVCDETSDKGVSFKKNITEKMYTKSMFMLQAIKEISAGLNEQISSLQNHIRKAKTGNPAEKTGFLN